MLNIQERINAMLAAEKRPSIALYPALEIVVPKRRSGWPKVRDDRMLFKHYADPRSNNRRARCLDCGRRLRRSQSGACSPECADSAVNKALFHLRLLGVPRDELMTLYKFNGPTPPDVGDAPVPRQPPSARRLKEARKAIS